MSTPHPVDALETTARAFGSDAAREKLRLLRRIGRIESFSARRIVRLHDTLYFMRAYPDDARVLDAVRAKISALREAVEAHTDEDPLHHGFLNTGLPGSSNAYCYSHAVLERLVELNPGAVEIDWEAETDDKLLSDALVLTIARGEMRGLEDAYVGLEEWLGHSRADPEETDLEVVLRLLRSSPLGPEQQKHVFEACNVPVVHHLREPGTGRCEVVVEPRRTAFQRRPIARETFPLRPRIVSPPERRRRLSPAAGRRMVDLSLRALCSRNLEIYPLIYADPADVALVDCGRGLQVMLSAVLSKFREVPESLLFFLILKNGVPIAYGPASVYLGCCEMGMNLFPEFRGGEVRFFYAQLMRSLYHLAGVRYFFITAYGMGEDNPEALKSGAFWFYRKMGFRATDPEAEALARAEERIMRRVPGHRSSLATLRRLSHTEAHLDLSGGRCSPILFARLGLAVSRHVTARFGGDRARAQRLGGRRLARVLGAQDYASWTAGERTAMEQLAPVYGMIPDLHRWPGRERRSLLTAIRARGAHDDMAYARKTASHRRLREAIEAIVATETTA
jgi:hypothetical protein